MVLPWSPGPLPDSDGEFSGRFFSVRCPPGTPGKEGGLPSAVDRSPPSRNFLRCGAQRSNAFDLLLWSSISALNICGFDLQRPLTSVAVRQQRRLAECRWSGQKVVPGDLPEQREAISLGCRGHATATLIPDEWPAEGSRGSSGKLTREYGRTRESARSRRGKSTCSKGSPGEDGGTLMERGRR